MKIEIIPATDIIGGACVRLTQGDYGRRTTYYRDPLEAAQRFEEAGIRRLHMVDLDGAKASEPRNLAVLERVATKTTLEVQYGGGIKSRGALRSEFDAGASRAICGRSSAPTSPATGCCAAPRRNSTLGCRDSSPGWKSP